MEDCQKVRLNSNLFLNQESNLPVIDLRYDKLSFNNKKHKFHNKFVQTGAVMIVPEGTKMMPRACADHSMLSTTELSAISHHKKIKLHHAMKEPHKDGAGRVEKGQKFYKPNREHREHKTFESKTRERDHEGGKSTLELSCSSLRKSTEKQGKERGKKMAKVAYKDHKMTSRESKDESGGQVDLQALSKRPLSATDSSNQSTKKQKRLKGCKEEGLITISSRTPSTNSAPTSTYLETKGPKIKMRHETPIAKTRTDSYSNSENETFSKDVRSVWSMTSSSCSSSSSDSEFEPLQMQSQGPLHSMVEHRLSQNAENNRRLEVETALKATPAIQDSCLFMDSDSDVEETYPQSQKKPSPIAKLNTKNLNLLQKENPDSSKKEKVLHRDKLGKAYTEELVDLHRRLMALRERNILQQIVNLIEKTGHFNITKTTFDFDLFSLDEPTVRKLQSYLPAKST